MFLNIPMTNVGREFSVNSEGGRKLLSLAPSPFPARGMTFSQGRRACQHLHPGFPRLRFCLLNRAGVFQLNLWGSRLCTWGQSLTPGSEWEVTKACFSLAGRANLDLKVFGIWLGVLKS